METPGVALDLFFLVRSCLKRHVRMSLILPKVIQFRQIFRTSHVYIDRVKTSIHYLDRAKTPYIILFERQLLVEQLTLIISFCQTIVFYKELHFFSPPKTSPISVKVNASGGPRNKTKVVLKFFSCATTKFKEKVR